MADCEKSDGSLNGDKNSETADKNTSCQFPAFVLYKYQPNRPKNFQSKSDDSTDSVANFLKKHATTDGNFSLSLVSTDLNGETEADVRDLISQKLGKGTFYTSHGSITTLRKLSVDIALCYYCLLHPTSQDSKQLGAGEPEFSTNEFVVCFLTEPDVSLELFKPELDRYSFDMMKILDSDPLSFFEIDELSQPSGIDTKVRPYLERWPREVMEYLSRCMERLEEDCKYLIYAALADIDIEVTGEDQEAINDINRFISCCSLSELLTQLQTENLSPTIPKSDINKDLEQLNLTSPGVEKKDIIKLHVSTASHTFNKQYCTPFCESWALALLNGDKTNPIFLKQVIENYKLKAIQDMNTLKRLIRQAETDHYALYRSYVFLQKCGSGSILLQHARLENEESITADTRDVLRVLDSFIQETGGLQVNS